MKKLNSRELLLYVIGFGAVAGIGRAILNSESNIPKLLGYSLFMGIVLGGALYLMHSRSKHR